MAAQGDRRRGVSAVRRRKPYEAHLTTHKAADLAARIARLEALEAIRELAVRYAMAVDARDLDAWVSLFVEDVDCNSHGRGRQALRNFIVPAVREFYRSIHFVAGHHIDLVDPDHATGQVYCRAEHEDGDKWIVMAICYFDTYARRNGEWSFVQRRERHWYAADILEQPMMPAAPVWPPGTGRPPTLPETFRSWNDFWASSAPDWLARITRQPV